MTDPFPGTFDTTLDHGKGKGHPAAPEPASWGVLGVGFALLVYLYVRVIRPRSRCGCGHHHS